MVSIHSSMTVIHSSMTVIALTAEKCRNCTNRGVTCASHVPWSTLNTHGAPLVQRLDVWIQKMWRLPSATCHSWATIHRDITRVFCLYAPDSQWTTVQKKNIRVVTWNLDNSCKFIHKNEKIDLFSFLTMTNEVSTQLWWYSQSY